MRILIADDHSVVRQGLRMFLELDAEIEVVGEARNGEEAMQLVEQLRPDVVLMDVLMPKVDGLAATQKIRQKFPDTEVLVLTSVLDEVTIASAVRNGAIGYLLKDTQAEDLCKSIHLAAEGKVQMSPEVAVRLASELCEEHPRVEELTAREREVLKLIASGSSNKDIAQLLFIAEKTVKAHVSNLLAKMGVQSRTQAALYAVQKGWV
ncbi:response regulator transcription factor [bacterium]|nr:response regulator transcription factor [bacterium]